MQQTIRSSTASTAAGFSFPAGSAAARAAAAASPTNSSSGAAAAHLRPLSGVSLPASTLYAHSSGSATGALKSVVHLPASPGKLATAVVAAVDDWYASHADANMPDGSFNPSLTLQQSADYEAVRQAAGLEGRINRGLVGVKSAM
jgi:hypothetical protein